MQCERALIPFGEPFLIWHSWCHFGDDQARILSVSQVMTIKLNIGCPQIPAPITRPVNELFGNGDRVPVLYVRSSTRSKTISIKISHTLEES